MPNFMNLHGITEVITDRSFSVDHRGSPTYVLGSFWSFEFVEERDGREYYTASRRVLYTTTKGGSIKTATRADLFVPGKLVNGKPKRSEEHAKSLIRHHRFSDWYHAQSVWPERFPCYVSPVQERIADVWFED